MALAECKECGGQISSKAKVCPHCGKKKSNGCGTLFLFLIGLGVVFFTLDRCFTTELTEEERQEQIEQRKLNSDLSWGYKSAKEKVLKELKSPSTAKFADFSEIRYKDNGDGSYIIESYVDSQNSFGATVRTKFRCSIAKFGGCKDLIFYD